MPNHQYAYSPVRISEMKRLYLLFLILVAAPLAAQPVQPLELSTQAEIVDVLRPRIAVGPDGTTAVALEALVTSDFGGDPTWQVAVQMFSPGGTPVGETHFFDGESCGTFDIWTSDFMEFPDIAFRSDGVLVVAMQHTGRFSIQVDDVSSSEITLGAITSQGELIDLNQTGGCVQQKLVFVGASEQDRPRIALTPTNEVIVIADGFFQDANTRNVAFRVLDNELGEVVDFLIPHEDPLSEQASHQRGDVATNGQRFLFTWQACPFDAQGNRVACDVGVQFVGLGNDGSLVAIGGNQTADSGDPAANFSVWPSADMDPQGNSVVVWVDTRTGEAGDVFGQRFNADGQPVGTNFQISTGEGEIQDRPEVAMRNDGGFMVVWYDESEVGLQAKGREYDAGGNPVRAPFRLSSDATLETGLPAVASTGSEFVHTFIGGRGGPLAVFTSNLGLVVANEPNAEVPEQVALLEAYPNPFTAATRIRFALDQSMPVQIEVYDVMGRSVRTLTAGPRPVGLHEVPFEAAALPAGTYLVQFRAGTIVQTQKVMLVR